MYILLIILGLVLIVINYMPIKKKNNSFNNILENQDNISKDYDLELMAIRKDMAETVLDLQKEIQELRSKIEGINNTNNTNNNEISSIKDEDNTSNRIELKEDYEDVISDINFNNTPHDKNTKANEIKQLLDKGYSDEEICTKLKIGKGEVLLIKGLYK